MQPPKELHALAEIFRRAGATDPESWARSQLEEAIPQLHRFLFLRAAWSCVVAEGDVGWIDREVDDAARQPDAPGAPIGPALSRLIKAGGDPKDISEVVRVMQWQLLFALCSLLDNGTAIQSVSGECVTPAADWGLFTVDQEGKPDQRIDCLHESVLGVEPSGREMRPRAGS